MPSAQRAIAACAILAVFAAGTAFAAPEVNNPAVTSFGAPVLSDATMLGNIAALSATRDSGTLALPDGFAASRAVTPVLALDSAYHGNVGQRFSNFDRTPLPSLSHGVSFMALADAGRYGGITFAPNANLSMRLGVSAWNGRFDNVSFDAPAATGLSFNTDRASVTSVLAGLQWNASDWASFGLGAISSYRRNVPLAYGVSTPLGQSGSTQAVEMSARFNLGGDWVTTTHFSQGFTQLNQRSGGESFDAQAYSITVAKQGVFGDDAVGISLSRPAPGMIGSFAALGGTGDLPPVMLAGGKNAAPETDLQIGYVTSFLNGRLALQANAGYQLNAQGQTGATSVSVLSRAKIKF